ncbi:MAG: hypothetical protein GY804_09065 [Alphaproteobacteria bacterium]|nr:hypothetical protein [Alphaproteobacteria bacterium]
MTENINWDAVRFDIVESDLKSFNEVYVDLGLIKDLRLMAYVCLDMSKERYDQIMSRISEYNKRYDNEVVKYFGLNDFTEEDITEFIQSPLNRDMLSCSFETELSQLTHMVVSMIIEHNKLTSSSVNLTVYINHEHFQPNDKLKEYLKFRFHKQKGVKVHFLHRPFEELDETFLKHIDCFFFDEFTRYQREGKLFSNMLYKMTFFNKLIYAREDIENDIREQKPKNVLKDTEDFMKMFSKFQYLNKTLI